MKPAQVWETLRGVIRGFMVHGDCLLYIILWKTARVSTLQVHTSAAAMIFYFSLYHSRVHTNVKYYDMTICSTSVSLHIVRVCRDSHLLRSNLPAKQDLQTQVAWRVIWKITNFHNIFIMMTSSDGIFSALLAFCAGNSSVTVEFPTQMGSGAELYCFLWFAPE